MKTYYDILEISRHASEEVLERAHKILIKRYHPDLETNPQKRKEKEEYIKKINEAYEVLSDEKKRKEYDLETFPEQSEKPEGKPQTNETSSYTNVVQKKQEDIINEEYAKIVNEEIQKAQERIDKEEELIKENLRKYERNYLRSLGYHIQEPINWKRIIITTLTIICMLILIWLIYLIPPIKNSINNEIEKKTVLGSLLNGFKFIYSIIGAILKAIFKRK